ncbi:unnamed protein product [Blepharisma stoltei]|uniref:Uncharacterized protein n=1 Tax=Blepharisma stoltei TaxID=1481888 RepID=A0AAU9JX81_9CILI|nr:unnamed protein product [Blepharisma stoltei]
MVKSDKTRGRPCNPIGSVLQYFKNPKKKESRSLNQKLTNSFYRNFYGTLKLNLKEESFDLYSSKFWPESFLNKDEREVFKNKEKSYFNVALSQALRKIYKNLFNDMVDSYAKELMENYNEKQFERAFNCKLDKRFKEPIRKKLWECLIIHHLAQIGKEKEETIGSQKFILELSYETEKYIKLGCKDIESDEKPVCIEKQQEINFDGAFLNDGLFLYENSYEF